MIGPPVDKATVDVLDWPGAGKECIEDEIFRRGGGRGAVRLRVNLSGGSVGGPSDANGRLQDSKTRVPGPLKLPSWCFTARGGDTVQPNVRTQNIKCTTPSPPTGTPPLPDRALLFRRRPWPHLHGAGEHHMGIRMPPQLERIPEQRHHERQTYTAEGKIALQRHRAA